MEANNRKDKGWLCKNAIWGLLALPLGVFLLPGFQTTLQEDILVLAVFLYLFLRTANEKRKVLSADQQTLLLPFLLSVLYGVGWFGLLRGYGDEWGRWLALYPLPLLAAFFGYPKETHKDSPLYTTLLYTIMVSSLFLIGATTLFFGIVKPEVFLSSPLSTAPIVPSLLVFPIIGCVVLVAWRIPPLIRGRDHAPILLIALIAMLCVWSGNIKTWVMWYQAGALERAWTPFKFDKPEEIEQAERKPYEAAEMYNQVRERILRKGDIPKFLNWPFFMQYRMAIQFMRKKEAWRCAQTLSFGEETSPKHMAFIKNLWHLEFMESSRTGKPDFPSDGLVWVDGELNQEKNRVSYLLDRWGRVFSIEQDGIRLLWDQSDLIIDAVDLEIYDDCFIVLRRNGEIRTSKPLALFNHQVIVPTDEEPAIDLEFFRSCEAAVVVNAFGKMKLLGSPPESFPSWEKLRFDVPAIADMELEPYENGYYLLDIHGGVHANHAGGIPSIPITSPPVPKELLPYWTNQDMAIDLELDPTGRGLYVYNRLGEIFTIAVTPYRETYRPPRTYPHRGIAIKASPGGNIFAIESNGTIVNIP